MSVQRVTCPGCSTTVNVPATMASARCPQCGTVWNLSDPASAQLSPAARQQASESEREQESSGPSGESMAIVATLVGGGTLLIAMIGLVLIVLSRSPEPSAASPGELEETIKPREPEEYRVVDLPDATRKRIYDDYRRLARTTTERPLALPQGTKVRQNVEQMLQGVSDRELMRFAALHDITVVDVKEIIKEGDAKVWDDSPRSHAVRDGKRVYSEEKSEGWKLNPNRK